MKDQVKDYVKDYVKDQVLGNAFLGLLPTESLTTSKLLGHLAVNFLLDQEFTGFLLGLLTDPVT